MNESLMTIEAAAKKATARSGDFYPKKIEGRKHVHAQYFFESWDDERMTFYFNLHDEGFHDVFYRAPYYWKLTNDEVTIEYVEGDVYVVCAHCLGTGEVSTDESDGEGHTMVGVGTTSCPCQEKEEVEE